MILEDLQGNELPFGKVRRELVAPFLDTGLPPWLSLISGTGAHIPPGVGVGGYELTTGAVAGNIAEIQCAFDIALDQFREIRWTIEGLRLSARDNSIRVYFVLTGTNAGVNCIFSGGSGEVRQLLSDGTAYNTPVPYRIPDPMQGIGRRNVTIRLMPRDLYMTIQEDDQIAVAMPLDAAAISPVVIRPRFLVQTTTSAARQAWVSQVKLALIHN